MAGYYLQASSSSVSGSADAVDWMAGLPGNANVERKSEAVFNSTVGSVAFAASALSGPVIKPAPVSWMNPAICAPGAPVPEALPGKRQKSADAVEKKNHKHTDWDKGAALAADGAQKSAAE